MGLVYLGWMPRERANHLTRALLVFLLLGFAVRVGAWLLSP